MTNQQAIAILECMAVDMTGAWGEMNECNPMVDVIRQRLDAINMAQDALRAQQELENPEPLTLDELREMGGEPVWIVWPGGRIGSQWWIVDNYDWHMMEFDDRNDYGKTWIAYRRKVEKGRNGDG